MKALGILTVTIDTAETGGDLPDVTPPTEPVSYVLPTLAWVRLTLRIEDRSRFYAIPEILEREDQPILLLT
jgi:hypothetical protein